MSRVGRDFCPCQEEVTRGVLNRIPERERRGCDRLIKEASKASDEATMHVI
jgi:hypothetical protein